jgi:nucleoside-diphosphate-sugar epimerase
MRIFVAGATGVLGRRAVRDLISAGHDVTGVARTEDKAAQLRAAGADAVAADLFDSKAVATAVNGFDVVCNLATHIPPLRRAALPGAWSTNDRIRNEASRHLADGALAGGAGRFIQESITFLYPDAGDRWLDESEPLEAVPNVKSVLKAEAAADHFTGAGGTGIVLRFAVFYGPDSSHTIDAIKAARHKLALASGNPNGYLSSIHTDDAASAVVAALDAAAGTYNIGDDEPVTRREHAEVMARALGEPRLRIVSRGVARLGGSKLELLTRSQRVSNRRFRAASGWAPAYPSVREGVPAVVTEAAASGAFG